MVFFPFVFLLSLFSTIFSVTGNKACADFNYGASVATLAGLEDVFICPADGYSRTVCNETFPVRGVDDVTQSTMTLGDIVFYILVGPGSAADAFKWWLKLIKEPTDIVIVADPCGGQEDQCDDHPSRLNSELQKAFPLVSFHLFRVHPTDVGYKILSCKLRTGAAGVLKLFPEKKYYFKIDTDTLVFPRRLIHFMRTMEAITPPTQPVYFGAVVESGMNLLLCGRDWADQGKVDKGGICYAQGGAGYGLNLQAMKVLAASPTCDPSNQDNSPEDTFVAMRMFNEFKIDVIHCGGFSSSELTNDRKMRSSITFHYIDSRWLNSWGQTLLDHYHHHDHSHGG